MSIDRLKARLGAAKAFLVGAKGDEAVAISREQKSAFLEQLSQAGNISAVDMGALVEFSSHISWQESDAKAVMHELTPSELTMTSCGKRRWMHNYKPFVAYITDTTWKFLLDPSVAQGPKLDAILNLFISLGARCPTEPHGHGQCLL